MSTIIKDLFTSSYSKLNNRYVNTFVPLKREFIKGKTILDDQEKALFEILKEIAINLGNMISKYPVIRELDEVIHMEVKDMEDLVFKVVVKDGKFDVKIGFDGTIAPSYHVPLLSNNIIHLKAITNDGDLSMEDIYRITRVLFIPFLQGLYNGDYSAMPKNKAHLQLDNFIQVVVNGPSEVVIEGFEGPAHATIVNVDGQWLMFEGLQGDPDVLYEMNMEQALKFAYLVSVKIVSGAKRGLPFTQILPNIKAYNNLKKEVLKYERSWHSIK